jgi:probable phosphoglycerate mutase
MPVEEFNGRAEDHSRANKQILFIRHGESDAHVGKAATHIEVVGLTEVGKIQAQKIAKEIPYAPDLIVVSPYLRAWETADPTMKRFSGTPHAIWPEVQEFTYLGSLAGTFTTKRERSKHVEAYWTHCDPHHKDGSAESFSEFVGRARKALDKLREELEKNNFIVVFTHEQFIRAVQCILLKWKDGTENAPQCMGDFRKMLLDHPLDYGHKDDASWQLHLLQEKDLPQLDLLQEAGQQISLAQEDVIVSMEASSLF